MCGCDAALWWNPAREPQHDDDCPNRPRPATDDDDDSEVLGVGMKAWDGSGWHVVRPDQFRSFYDGF